MQLRSNDFEDGQPIPRACAFGKPGDPIALSDNRNPHLAWRDAPAGTRSFVLTCIDPDAPSRGDDVNKQGRTVSADLPRTDFVHWLMTDIPADCGELGNGACSDGITPHGKRAPTGPSGSRQGENDYSGWFASDPEMAGTYLGYDGPCPPWNDARVHRYRFELHALDTPGLGLSSGFSLDQLRAAMDGHVLASATLTGTYAINPDAK